MAKKKCVRGPVRLNLGSGDKPLAGYRNIDRKLGGEIFPLAEYDDETVDEIRASHVLEHVSHREVEMVLREWVRVLKPGGVLRVAVPDFKWIAEHYLAGEPVEVQGYTMGGQVDKDDFHRTIFDKEMLSGLLTGIGLVDVEQWRSDADDCATLEVSLNLQATKPKPLPPMKVACAMSVPRLGFQDNFFSWAKALMPYKISPHKYEGAYWGQCLERVLTDLAADNEWILAVDYDSIFGPEEVGALLRLAVENPHADAIAAVQMARGRVGSKPLQVVRNADGSIRTLLPRETMASPLLKVQTAHFGLTLLKTEKLRQMPHPWFVGQPAPDGTWGEGRIDDDIHFWLQWSNAGNSLYVANRVVIGHAELMFTWPDQNFDAIHQYPSEWHETGKPEKAWQ